MALDANLQVGLKSSGELFTASNGIAMASVHHHVTAQAGYVLNLGLFIMALLNTYVRMYIDS